MLGNGDGSFGTPQTFGVGSRRPVALATGDFNGDGAIDLAVLSDAVQMWLGNGDGTFRATLTFGVGYGPKSLAVGDFNNDGQLDLAAANGSNKVAVLINNTFPRFTLAVGKTGEGTGTISSTPPGIDCGTDCSESYASGANLTLTAFSDDGSLFTGWTGCDAVAETNCTVTMNAARSVVASFDRP